MSTILNFGRDIQGINALAPQYSTDLFSVKYTDSTGYQFSIPTNYQTWIMYITVQPDSYIWVSHNGDVAVPTGALDSTESEMVSGNIPYQRLVYAGDIIQTITDKTPTEASIALYALLP